MTNLQVELAKANKQYLKAVRQNKEGVAYTTATYSDSIFVHAYSKDDEHTRIYGPYDATLTTRQIAARIRSEG